MSRIGSFIFCFTCVVAMFLATTASAQATTVIRYVRADQTSLFSQQDGLSWPTAFRYAQDAIDDSVAYHQGSGQSGHIVQIWVKGGTTSAPFVYIPNEDGDFEHLAGQEESFLLWNFTELYGGFAGTESSTEFGLRDPVQNVTVLSGDNLDNDSIPHFDAGTFTHASFDDNSYHVVRSLPTSDSSAVIDGFTITAGMTQLVTFPSIVESYGGGVLLTYQGVDPNNGPSSAPTVRNCKLERNYSALNGGGMFIDDYPTSRVRGCTYFKNFAGIGGGLFAGALHTLAVDNTFTQNRADGSGGGMYVPVGNCQIINGQFIDNYASGSPVSNGGGLWMLMLAGGARQGGAEVTNCVFRDNRSDGDGAGMYASIDEPGTVELQNNTFYANVASGDGGGIGLAHSGIGPGSRILALQNCILYANTGSGNTLEQQIENVTSASYLTYDIDYSDVEGWCAYGGVTCGSFGTTCSNCYDSTNHTLDVNPAFKDVDNLALQGGSLCIETGNNSFLPQDTGDLDDDGITITVGTTSGEELPYDIVHSARKKDAGFTAGAVVDMGAYEWDPGCTADLTGTSCAVDGFDLATLLGQWGPCSSCSGDFDGDGDVDGFDLANLLAAWGPCPTGSCEESLLGGGGEQSQQSESEGGGGEEAQEDAYPMLAWWFVTGDYAAIFAWAAGQ